MLLEEVCDLKESLKALASAMFGDPAPEPKQEAGQDAPEASVSERPRDGKMSSAA